MNQKSKHLSRKVMYGCTVVVLLCMLPATGQTVKLIFDPSLSGPARHGMTVLERALEEAGATVHQDGDTDLLLVAGLATSDGPATRLLRASNTTIPTSAESLTIKRMDVLGRPAVVLCGADERGLMYALLDTAERIGWCQDDPNLFSHIQDIHETPTIQERAISTYTMQRRYFEQRLFDEHYWQRYFDLLAASRINRFVIIFGYENGGFMAPAYPYFFDVEGFPQVEMVGVSHEQQAHHTHAFKRMIQIAHERGVDITVGFWDHIYRGKVQGGGIPGASALAGTRTPHVVVGVTTENLVAYNKAAMKKFLAVFPEIDGIQLRMHWESGLTREETPAFWHDMFAIMKRARPNLQIDLRAKGLPDPVIEDAIAQGINFRIATKYWMEQMGLPFHPTHINRKNQRDRRHGYADLLIYPKRYPIHWRLWSGGTARCLLWGDPDYVRRFTESARLYQGNSFEVNEMLATKMLGEAHDSEPFHLLQAKYRYYEYEFERYWHYYQVWGRVSYNPHTPTDVWQQAFERRFGQKAGKHLMQGVHLASRVLPRIVASAYSYRNFPTTRGWAEMMRQGDLAAFAKAEGSDIEQFQNAEDAAKSRVNNETTTKRTPAENSRWFAQTSQAILREVAAAQNAGAVSSKKEFHSTVTDLKILAYLAQYYAERIPAAVDYNLYLLTEDVKFLKTAIDSESRAVSAWQRIVQSAGDVYTTHMAFGVEAVGFPRHWRDELAKLKSELQQLQTRYKTVRSRQDSEVVSNQTDAVNGQVEDKSPPQVHLEHVAHARPHVPLTVVAKVTDPSGIASVRLRYRHLTQFEDYQTEDMQYDPQTGLWSGTIPGKFITPEWDLMYYLEVQDNQGNGRMVPDLDKQMPYVVVELER